MTERIQPRDPFVTLLLVLGVVANAGIGSLRTSIRRLLGRFDG